MLLTSSQAHEGIDCKNQFLLIGILFPLVTFSLGCGSPVGLSADLSSSSTTVARKSPIIYDAGVVFANEASYVCIPLEKLGIDVGEDIVSIKSSCECVRPSVVRYLKRKSVDGVAMRFDFAEESKAQVEPNPIALGVELTVQFANGGEQSVMIQFLHAPQCFQEFQDRLR